MREWEMRRRIERALTQRMRGVLAPTLGLGMAIVGFGCGGTEYGAQHPYYSPQRLDAGDSTQDGAGPGQDVPLYPTPTPRDAATVDAPASLDTPSVDTADELDTSLDAEQTVDQR